MSLDNTAFLHRVVELYNLIYIDDSVLLIDINNTILFAGNKIQKLTNIAPESLIGKNHLEVLPLPPENINSIVASVNKVIQTKATGEFLSINLNHNPDYLILDCTLKPIINPSNNCIVAISVESRQLDASTYLYKLLMFFERNKVNSSLNIPHSDDKLTLREHEIAFLLLYYKSPKKIAAILNNLSDKPVSAKTVSNIISGGLYPKLNVYGIDDLINALHILQYHNKIPVSFLVNLHLELA